MSLRLHLPAALWRWLTDPPPVVDVIAPPDRPEWDRELRKLQGLTEIHRCTLSNVVFYDFASRKARVSR